MGNCKLKKMSEEEKANGENVEGKVSNWENLEDAILTEKKTSPEHAWGKIIKIKHR